MDLQGRIGILTGASRGIGRVIASTLAKRGVSLALAARTEEGVKEAAEAVGRAGVRALPVRCDVTKHEDLERLVRVTREELGEPDLLVNNAGIETVAVFEELTPEEIEAVMTTNAIAPQWLARLVVPGMIARGRGHIVNISSLAGKTGPPHMATYAASKHALVGFSWCLRAELKPHGVGVSVICPGFIKEVGMYDEWSYDKPPPMALRAVDVETVASKVVKAIEQDLPEVVVTGSPASKVADVLHAVSPDAADRLMRTLGVHRYLTAEARIRPRS